jgi:3-oxoacyl-[acyl-carrier-protein] synthase II
MSNISGFGIGMARFEQALFCGETAVAPVPFDTSGTRSRKAVSIAHFDPSEFIPANRLRRIDRIGQVTVACGRLTLQDAGLDNVEAVDRGRLGVVLGSSTAGLHTVVRYLDNLIEQGVEGGSALDFSNTVGNAAASLCGLELGLRGPNVTLNYKEASAAAAIAYASSVLATGQADAVLTGGVEDFEGTYFAVHDAFRSLAWDDGCGEASRPFDRRRNGFVIGSGGYLLALETEAMATERAAPRLGYLVGVGASAGPCRLNAWPHDVQPLARCMNEALTSAGASRADVAAVFASANSTPALDRVEASALTQVFGPAGVPVVALKGALGESGASGAAGLQAAILALRSGRLPPTVGFAETDPDCFVNVSSSTRDLPARSGQVAVVNSFASGGTNYSLVVRL